MSGLLSLRESLARNIWFHAQLREHEDPFAAGNYVKDHRPTSGRAGRSPCASSSRCFLRPPLRFGKNPKIANTAQMLPAKRLNQTSLGKDMRLGKNATKRCRNRAVLFECKPIENTGLKKSLPKVQFSLDKILFSDRISLVEKCAPTQSGRLLLWGVFCRSSRLEEKPALASDRICTENKRLIAA